jgi:hypothetical protein
VPPEEGPLEVIDVLMLTMAQSKGRTPLCAKIMNFAPPRRTNEIRHFVCAKFKSEIEGPSMAVNRRGVPTPIGALSY